jgi:hypothetical protein
VPRLQSIPQGLSHALRWVLLDCPTGASMPGRDNAVEEAAAATLLRVGADYSRLCSAFVPWSRGLMRAQISLSDRRICFSMKSAIDNDFFRQQLEADLDWWVKEYATWPFTASKRLVQAWSTTVSVTRAGLFFNLQSISRDQSFHDFVDWTKAVVLPELGDDIDFGEYTLKDLRTFLAATHALSNFICDLELTADEKGVTTDMGSWVLVVPATDAPDTFQRITSVPSGICERILADLSFNPLRFHSNISSSPFVTSRRGTVFFSPWTVRNSVPQRTALRALVCGSARRTYDTVSGEIEKHYVSLIARQIGAMGYRVIVERRFWFTQTEVKPDILVLDGKNELRAIIEFKNSLAATTTGALIDRMKEYHAGVRQLKRAVSLFMGHRREMEQRGIFVGNAPLRLCLLLRLPLPMPVPRVDDVLAIDWHTVERGGFLRELIEGVTPHVRTAGTAASFVTSTTEIPVGKWRFEIPVWSVRESSAST